MQGAHLTPQEAMRLALEEAKKGFGFVAPNPPVGCAILDRHGALLSLGYHTACGQAHAEVEAVNKLDDPSLLEGAHVFVTLEPCAHEGKTPSCAKMLARLPIQKVSYALKDPNPLVSGQGADILKKAGIETEEMTDFQDAAEDVAEIFLHNMRTKTPFVALKVATSLDGQMALKNGESQWITNEQAREQAQYLRGCYDAVLIGLGTFEHDNPRLNSRHPLFSGKTNKVVLLDPNGKSLLKLATSKLLEVRPQEQVLVVIGSEASDPPQDLKGVQFIRAQVRSDGEFDLSRLMSELYERKISSLYVEGGANVFSAFLKAGLGHRLYQFLAPSLLGAQSGLSFTKDLSISSLDQRIQLKKLQYSFYGDNLLVSGRITL